VYTDRVRDSTNDANYDSTADLDTNAGLAVYLATVAR
jgi:hypothetical protein